MYGPSTVSGSGAALRPRHDHHRSLQLKMGLKIMDDERLRRLTEVSNYVSELTEPDA